MSKNVKIANTTYNSVPSINIPLATGTGNASFFDVSDTTATAADVSTGKYFYTSAGVLTQGTNSGGGGSSMNTQVAQSTTRANTTSYTEVISLTCTVTGTYDIYWTTFRTSTSSTWGSQLYINDTAYGSATTSGWSNHVQNMHLTSVSLSANDEVAVRVRSRGSSYYGYVGTLTIIQKS